MVLKTYKKKLGFIIPNLGDNQLTNTIIKSANNYLVKEGDFDIIIFFEEIGKPFIIPLFGYMSLAEIASFDGLLVSTTLRTTLASIHAVNAATKLFYIFSLEFLRDKRNFIENVAIYRNPDIELATFNQHYANTVENYCNRLPHTMNFNIEDFICYYQNKL